MKYRILYQAHSNGGGVPYHRLHVPLNYLNDTHPEFEVQWVASLDGLTDEYIKGFHLFTYSRTTAYGYRKNLMDQMVFKVEEDLLRIKKLGLPIVGDIDDYWELEKSHPLYWKYILDHVRSIDQKAFEIADYITCTTPHFADVLSRHKDYDKIFVLPNAVNPDLPQFQPKPTRAPFLRFGWFGSVNHVDDVATLVEPMKKLSSDKTLKDKFQLVLGGMTMNDKVMIQDPKTGQRKEAFISDYNKIYGKFERTFTDEYRLVRDLPNYQNWLWTFKNETPEVGDLMPYKRIWARDIHEYATGYNEVDVSLAPLCNHLFNNCKSQLKLIEAGFMKKAFICSQVMPYTIDAINGVNALTCNVDNAWYMSIKKLINNPNMVDDLGEALYETVKEKYHIRTVTEARAQLYKDLIEKHNKC